MPEPRTIRVNFPGDIADALIEVSLDEHRHPSDQVVVFVRDALRQLGRLSERSAGSVSRPCPHQAPVSMYIKLRGDVATVLGRVSRSCRRNPRVQAALYIEEALRGHGELPIDATRPGSVQAVVPPVAEIDGTGGDDA